MLCAVVTHFFPIPRTVVPYDLTTHCLYEGVSTLSGRDVATTWTMGLMGARPFKCLSKVVLRQYSSLGGGGQGRFSWIQAPWVDTGPYPHLCTQCVFVLRDYCSLLVCLFWDKDVSSTHFPARIQGLARSDNRWCFRGFPWFIWKEGLTFVAKAKDMRTGDAQIFCCHYPGGSRADDEEEGVALETVSAPEPLGEEQLRISSLQLSLEGLSTGWNLMMHKHESGVRKRSASSKPTTKFAQPRLSRAICVIEWHRSNTLELVASDLGNTSHIGTNTPKFVPSRWGWPPFDLLKQSCANSGGSGARWKGWFPKGWFWRNRSLLTPCGPRSLKNSARKVSKRSFPDFLLLGGIFRLVEAFPDFWSPRVGAPWVGSQRLSPHVKTFCSGIKMTGVSKTSLLIL